MCIYVYPHIHGYVYIYIYLHIYRYIYIYKHATWRLWVAAWGTDQLPTVYAYSAALEARGFHRRAMIKNPYKGRLFGDHTGF